MPRILLDRKRWIMDNTYVRLFDSFNIRPEDRCFFQLQVDAILENAVYPLEISYAENVMELWNIYMPGYEFQEIVLEYSKTECNVLRFIHDEKLSTFENSKALQTSAIKNYVKYRISQGCASRMLVLRDCFDVFRDITDSSKLYESINNCLRHYFGENDIDQNSLSFLRRFQDNVDQPYECIIRRMKDRKSVV